MNSNQIRLIIAWVLLLVLNLFAVTISTTTEQHWHYFGNNSTLSCTEQCNWTSLVESNFGPELHTLQKLSVVNSGLTDITSFPRLQELQVFNLSHNLLSTFGTFSQGRFPSVRVLDLQHNDFKVVFYNTFAVFPNLEILDLSWNKLQSINSETFNLHKLRRLLLSHNNITKLGENVFRFLPSLEFVDLSFNSLFVIQSSSLVQSQSLQEINFSFNHILKFEYNSFSPLYQLKILDLSYNQITDIAGGDFRQLIKLRELNLSGNPIVVLQPNSLILQSLQDLIVSDCKSLRVVDSDAFAQIPNLRFIDLSGSTLLEYIAPTAFGFNSTITKLSLHDSGLKVLSENVLRNVEQASLYNNPLQCGCLHSLSSILEEKVKNLNNVTCVDRDGSLERFIAVSGKDGCDVKPILPFGDVVQITVGDSLSIYCVPKLSIDEILWTLPKQTNVSRNTFSFSTVHQSRRYTNPSYYLFHSSYYGNKYYRPRIEIGREKLRFNVVIGEDSGIYKCTAKRNQYATAAVSMKLIVIRPAINLSVVEVGPYYITVAWNASLRIKAKDRVFYFLSIENIQGSTNKMIQLSLYNPWYKYNIVRLKPDSNYTICLSYALRDNSQEVLLYKTCTNTSTSKIPTMFGSIGIIFLTLLSTSSLIFCFITCLNFIHLRIDVSQLEKHRSRMNQSTSGQSILTNNTNGRDITMSFENYCQEPASTTEVGYRLAIIDPRQHLHSASDELNVVEDLNL